MPPFAEQRSNFILAGQRGFERPLNCIEKRSFD